MMRESRDNKENANAFYLGINIIMWHPVSNLEENEVSLFH